MRDECFAARRFRREIDDRMGDRVPRAYDPAVYTDPFYLACLIAWLALWAYWIASIPKQKAERIAESSGDRATQILPMAATYTLLFSPAASYGWLGHRVLPASRGLEGAAMFVATMGVAFAIWARGHLGSNWSARVSIRADHELIRTGPYRRIRHPIYTGMILATIGTAGVIGEVRGVLAVLITCAAFSVKARREERFLTGEFGSRFAEHRRETGMFVPRLR
jgi:protein-S-isoprenylcysteine O-methyltransferase Ste14